MGLTDIFKGIWEYIKKADIFLWLIIAIISLYSVALLNSVSEATNTDYSRTHIMAIFLGVTGAILLSLIDYSICCNFWHVLGIFSILIMIYTILFGIPILGSDGVNAKAWINLAGRTFQPSELVKICFILTFAKHLDVVKMKGEIDNPLHVLILAVHAAVPVMLCHFQGDDGTGIVFLFMFLAMSFSANIKLRYFLIFAIVLTISIPFLWDVVFSEYQRKRFTAVYNLDNVEVQSENGYQQYHGRISIGSGQFSGFGLGNGKRVAKRVVSFQQSDFIFSVAGEELGFVGCVAILLLLFLLLLKTLHVASVARDDLGKYICFGFFGMVAIQSIANIGMCLAILPVMGVTLPFFSSGGSSAMCLYFGFGLVQSVYIHRKTNDGSRLTRNEPLRIKYKQMSIYR